MECRSNGDLSLPAGRQRTPPLGGRCPPWGRVDFFFGDERCVPPDDPGSNYHMAKDALLDRIAALNIEVLTHTRLLAVGEGWVEIAPENRIRRTLQGVDNVVFCTGYAPRKAETDALEGLGVPVHYAGAVRGSRKFFQAIEEGTLTALRIV